MTEVLFYHLEHQPLERVLPSLVEKTLERGWRAVVQAGSEERVEALDTLLWTYRDESFLPHGTRRDGNPALQPVYLTTGEDNPNGATVRFLVDGAETADLTALRPRRLPVRGPRSRPPSPARASSGPAPKPPAATSPTGSSRPKAAGRRRRDRENRRSPAATAARKQLRTSESTTRAAQAPQS